jgi:hypothetical protein
MMILFMVTTRRSQPDIFLVVCLEGGKVVELAKRLHLQLILEGYGKVSITTNSGGGYHPYRLAIA